LQSHGVDVIENYLGMDTAFLGSIGSGDPKIAVFAEYDALGTPESPLGHACGHNLIAAWAYGVASAFKKSGLPKGTLYIVGSPAEESREKYASSKIVIGPHLKEMGVQAVFAVHPFGEWRVGGGWLASSRSSFIFRGRHAHTAISPEQGLNALDAAVHFYLQVKMMRTMVRRDKDVIISAIIREGGIALNIIPSKSEVWLSVRANDSQYLNELMEKTRNVAKYAAEMTGCSVEWSNLAAPLDSMKRYPELDNFYYRHALQYLPQVTSPDQAWSKLPIGSTDVANVSQIIPTTQFLFKIGREGLPGHSEEWKQQAGTFEAEQALLTSVAIAFDAINDYLSPSWSTK
jgi:amidohydrolase